MNSSIWSGAYYVGVAVVLAVDVAFPHLVWLAAFAVVAGYGWLLRIVLRAMEPAEEI